MTDLSSHTQRFPHDSHHIPQHLLPSFNILSSGSSTEHNSDQNQATHTRSHIHDTIHHRDFPRSVIQQAQARHEHKVHGRHGRCICEIAVIACLPHVRPFKVNYGGGTEPRSYHRYLSYVSLRQHTGVYASRISIYHGESIARCG
ncbi:hypothetical protein EX30DRAFT_69027 [Ascodesmis nigricans]|uniref:Uncharacterized protein n=1 Tax=Ascodesmis nigricans TaxID=341454 RepID=A0A4S2MUC2_9PEZI|nr:hypothetical protein EX30DRAFT_69027 [Ascodesmis nigricans]